VEVLGSAHAVAAEDTRRTRALLSHLGIGSKPVLALHAHSSDGAVAAVVERLIAGEDVALVTDAGTPAVSDPGRALVTLARSRGVSIQAIPGASAVTAAVALSGLVDGPFTFLGFWPRQPSLRRDAVQRVAKSREAVVFFESAQRLSETLAELAAELPERAAFIGRELTKLHEEGIAGPLCELASPERAWRGEIVAVVAANPSEPEADAERRELVFASLRAALEAGASPSRIARGLAEASGLPRRELYERALALSKEIGVSEEEGD
ncbi:MAG TPA: 16S rRNA (cytidine(1402)-2'-O)-methyltransferase, partial [Polyangiaceae bacterium]|nr:16S rRNA (cytidine(1402)-2'-O)-methyltransferase [Polyangiaceae bacterium]